MVLEVLISQLFQLVLLLQMQLLTLSIILGHADVMVTGGSEAAVTIAGMGGFNAMHALSTRNDDPTLLDQWTRTETALGEGCRSINSEEYEHAIARGATIYCEIGGGGMSADAYTY
jgi:3-oxoacyl-[acyl-carrier-protein] synthase II